MVKTHWKTNPNLVFRRLYGLDTLRGMAGLIGNTTSHMKRCEKIMRRFWSLWQSLAAPSLARHHQMASALIPVPDQLGPRLRAGKPIIWQREALDGATVMSQAAFSTVVCQDNSPFSVFVQTREKTWRRFFLLICLLDSRLWPQVTVGWHLILGLPFFCPPKDSSNHKVIIMWLLLKEWRSKLVTSLVIECVRTFQASEHPAEIVCDIKANGFSPIWLCCCNYSTGITAQMSIYWVHLLNNEKTTWHLPSANTAKPSSGAASEHCGGVLTYREGNHFTYTLIDA